MLKAIPNDFMAWNAVSRETLQNCLKHSSPPGIVSPNVLGMRS